jgi:ferritin-like metal-binding protein YciE
MATTATAAGSMAGNERVQEIYLGALRNTHALLKQAEDMIERQVERYEQYPELTAALRQHRDEIPTQIAAFERIMESHGTSASTFKDLVTQTVGNIGAAIHSLATDEVLKNIYTDHALERHEVAAFTSLIAIAEAAGDAKNVPTFEQFRQTHERAGQKVLDQVRPVTMRYIQIEAQGGAGAGKN